jgi:hypothetical protein
MPIFIKTPEYIVYETLYTTFDPVKGLKVGHPEAVYSDYAEMIDEWSHEFYAGTHNFFVVEKA